jgi:hypothetical protein
MWMMASASAEEAPKLYIMSFLLPPYCVDLECPFYLAGSIIFGGNVLKNEVQGDQVVSTS